MNSLDIKLRMQRRYVALSQQGSIDDLALGLGLLMKVQQDVSSPVQGAIPEAGVLPTKDAIRTYTLAMMIELAEFVQTLDWKPWKSKTSMADKEKTPDEFADILAFVGVILANLYEIGITPQDLAEAYRIKSRVNIERFLGQHGEQYKQV